MKVCLVMFYDENIRLFGDITYTINQKYCQKNNLDILVSNKKKI